MIDDQLVLEQTARMIALHEDVRAQEYLLVAPICAIGRTSVCEIVVQRRLVSRIHARIERDGLRYLLYDVGSANGTFVNNRRLSGPHLLNDQDLIGLGAPTPLLRFLDPDPTFVPSMRLRYDDRAFQFSINHTPLHLPPNQFRLLLHLYQYAGDLCSRKACAQAIWDHAYDEATDGDALDRTVYKLRRTLRECAGDDLITTRRGVGYMLEE